MKDEPESAATPIETEAVEAVAGPAVQPLAPLASPPAVATLVAESIRDREAAIATLLRRSVGECLIKNALIVIVTVALYSSLAESLSSIRPEQTADFLFLISIMLVTACFANFAFSYEYSILETWWMRLISHLTTFLFMLLIGLLLLAMAIAIEIIHPNLYKLVRSFCLLLYFSCALYDFWDLFRKFKVVRSDP